MTVWGTQYEAFREIEDEQEHETYLYPDSTEKGCTLTAGGTNNTFSDWAEIDIDGDGETLSSKITSNTHITAILLEDLSLKDKRYMLEIAYGDDKTIIFRHRFLTGEAKKIQALVFIRIRAVMVPPGEKIYYQMKCETALATCEVCFRYHYHT